MVERLAKTDSGGLADAVNCLVLGTCVPLAALVLVVPFWLASELWEIGIDGSGFVFVMAVLIVGVVLFGVCSPIRIRSSERGIRLHYLARRMLAVPWSDIASVTKWQGWSLSIDARGTRRVWLPAPITARRALLGALSAHGIDVTYWSDRPERAKR